MRSAGARYGKKVLVELSHAIEKFALAADPGSPMVVIAMFQKLSYFEREVDVYRDIGALATVTLVGLVEDFPPRLPDGVRHVLLDPRDELAREWSVTVLGPHGGASLVATDLETVDPDAPTIEAGRSFTGHWSFRREDAYREVLRLRSQLTLPAATMKQIDAVLYAVLAEPEPAEQEWFGVSLRFVAERMERALQACTVARRALGAATEDGALRDPRTGLYTARFLERWTAGLGAGTLPIGLVMLRIHGVGELRPRYGLRAELAALKGVTDILAELLTGPDRAIQLSSEHFLIVLPSRAPRDVEWVCDQVCRRIAQLDQFYPYVALPTAAAVTVTRQRPLPLLRLADEIESHGGPVAVAVS